MADLYGVGCLQCNREIAAALKELPHMHGYLSAVAYNERYAGTPMPWPLPYVDGECLSHHTIATVTGDDGWLLCIHGTAKGCVCSCGSHNVAYELWRGVVEIR